MFDTLQLGLVATSTKPHEKRLPLHPEHLPLVPERLRKSLVLERGYGERFGFSDGELRKYCGGFLPRAQLLQETNALLLLKPAVEDLQALPEGSVVWGWPHCVQQREIAQAAIDRKLTLIAFEAMFSWGPDGSQGLHSFYKNNEIAGYAAVLHALSLKGQVGRYGPRRKAVILGAGSVSRGAVQALQDLGVQDITVCRVRPPHLYREEAPGCVYQTLVSDRRRPGYWLVQESMKKPQRLSQLLSEADWVVNAVFQDPTQPAIFVHEDEFEVLKRQCQLIDVSCDAGMGFAGARPTSFDAPMIQLQGLDYYAVDHTPSYLWQSATWEISRALLPYLESFLGGPEAWQREPVLHRAVDIQAGVIHNENILKFQRRQREYPHVSL